MNVIQLFNCMRGKHVRSRGSAWHDGDTVRSKCRGCGTPMVRRNFGWELDSDLDEEAASTKE